MSKISSSIFPLFSCKKYGVIFGAWKVSTQCDFIKTLNLWFKIFRNFKFLLLKGVSILNYQCTSCLYNDFNVFMKSHWAEIFQAPRMTQYFWHENNGKIEEDILEISFVTKTKCKNYNGNKKGLTAITISKMFWYP